jgi:hypothetical protein
MMSVVRETVRRIPAEWAAAMTIFDKKGPVWETLERAAGALERAGTPHALIGGLACFLHGYRRNTVDVDLLVPAAESEKVRAALEEEGFTYDVQRREFRLVEGVPLQLVMSGSLPGRSTTSAVVFPEPDDPQATEEIEGFRTLALARLIEVKLASALANPRRARDGADVMELIDIHGLDKSYAPKLNRAVRPEFKRLVDIVRNNPP